MRGRDLQEAIRVDELSLEASLEAREPLVRIVPEILLGEFDPRIHFHMVCWVAANALAEGIIRPYRAARRALTLSEVISARSSR